MWLTLDGTALAFVPRAVIQILYSVLLGGKHIALRALNEHVQYG